MQLKNETDLLVANSRQFSLIETGQVPAIKQHLAKTNLQFLSKKLGQFGALFLKKPVEM